MNLWQLVLINLAFVSTEGFANTAIYDEYVTTVSGAKESTLYASGFDLTGNGLQDYLIASDSHVASSGTDYTLFLQVEPNVFEQKGTINAVDFDIVNLPEKGRRAIRVSESMGGNEYLSTLYYLDGAELVSVPYRQACQGPSCERDFEVLKYQGEVQPASDVPVEALGGKVSDIVSPAVYAKLPSLNDRLCRRYTCTGSFENPDHYTSYENAYLSDDLQQFLGVVDTYANQFVEVYQDDQGYWKVKRYLGINPPVSSSSAGGSSSVASEATKFSSPSSIEN